MSNIVKQIDSDKKDPFYGIHNNKNESFVSNPNPLIVSGGISTSNPTLVNQKSTQKKNRYIESNDKILINFSKRDFSQLKKMILKKHERTQSAVINEEERIYIIFKNMGKDKRICLIYGNYQLVIEDKDEEKCPYFKLLFDKYLYFKIIIKENTPNIAQIINEPQRNILYSLLYYYDGIINNRITKRELINDSKPVTQLIKQMKNVVQSLSFKGFQIENYKGAVNFQGKANGKGTYYNEDDKSYTGKFKNGIPDVTSNFIIKITKTNKKIYEGKINKNFEKHGEGTYYKEDDKSYKGKFLDDSPDNNTTFIIQDGENKIYEGKINDNYQKNGAGTSYYKSGNKEYYGMWSEDLKNSDGKLYYDEKGEKIQYDGNFQNDLKDGEGAYYDKEGKDIYNGEWDNNLYKIGIYYNYYLNYMFSGEFIYEEQKRQLDNFKIKTNNDIIGTIFKFNSNGNNIIEGDLIFTFDEYNNSNQQISEGKLYLSKHKDDKEIKNENNLCYIQGGTFNNFNLNGIGNFIYRGKSLELDFKNNVPTLLIKVVANKSDGELWEFIYGLDMEGLGKLYTFLEDLINKKYKYSKENGEYYEYNLENIIENLNIDLSKCQFYNYYDGVQKQGKKFKIRPRTNNQTKQQSNNNQTTTRQQQYKNNMFINSNNQTI